MFFAYEANTEHVFSLATSLSLTVCEGCRQVLTVGGGHHETEELMDKKVILICSAVATV